jgi:hypothetical protein
MGALSETRTKAGSPKNYMAYISMKYYPLFDDPYILELYDEAYSDFAETRFKGLAEIQDFIIYGTNSASRTEIFLV